ncbi:succinate dehydrogenase/fumarate reductase iron-sulfur subunit [Persicimonas caeni]|jgi:succinate dehydrogenase / fumarate reductase iron-sulfur subunit|uniref:succinate dehydrogenase n=1 Tax=Persicimonas caeni TaxID=2292766 RepID=A0A4Y6Q2W9_PERCE|nr:succinate dehydrogenase/fumarate reductase iron-sulfur subunit [Persicimonas caeni]QED36159.1 succinate dehydrogenase/fumarate reductase iron-sulfur subunit [Persicimonas caeni]
MTLHLKVWRQKDANSPGRLESITAEDITGDMSFLEMMDLVNERLVQDGKEPVEFDSDCREGICGTCGLTINGQAHGPERGTAVCQLHMRSFSNGDTIVIEPFRARAFPVVKDLVVDRAAFDRIIQSGGYTSVTTGPHADANTHLVPKPDADRSFFAATCIGCGACVAACPNASASLFTSAKLTQYAMLPQGQAEREIRTIRMINQMDEEGFGNCSNIGECSAVCPKNIELENISRMRREYLRAIFKMGGQAEHTD